MSQIKLEKCKADSTEYGLEARRQQVGCSLSSVSHGSLKSTNSCMVFESYYELSKPQLGCIA